MLVSYEVVRDGRTVDSGAKNMGPSSCVRELRMQYPEETINVFPNGGNIVWEFRMESGVSVREKNRIHRGFIA